MTKSTAASQSSTPIEVAWRKYNYDTASGIGHKAAFYGGYQAASQPSPETADWIQRAAQQIYDRFVEWKAHTPDKIAAVIKEELASSERVEEGAKESTCELILARAADFAGPTLAYHMFSGETISQELRDLAERLLERQASPSTQPEELHDIAEELRKRIYDLWKSERNSFGQATPQNFVRSWIQATLAARPHSLPQVDTANIAHRIRELMQADQHLKLSSGDQERDIVRVMEHWRDSGQVERLKERTDENV